MASTIEIEGLGPLLRKLGKIEGLKILKAGLLLAGGDIKKTLQEYPPQTAANVPKAIGSWYVRGSGGFYRSSTGIKKTSKSETLDRKWTVKARKSGFQVVVGNNVSYGPYVQGPDEQASWMKRIGWKNTDQIAESEGPKVNALVKQELDMALR